tara:strand:- start:1205 stop:1432 length:228 start_codon:yes stop_codon:yes gene_type:complete
MSGKVADNIYRSSGVIAAGSAGGEITAFDDAWKNYNDVDTTTTMTIPTTKNYFLGGPISVTSSAVWTIDGLLRII